MWPISRLRSSSGSGSELIASVAVPMAGDSVSAPEVSPAAKPGSRPRMLATAHAASNPVTVTQRPSPIGRRPSLLSVRRNCGPTE